MAATILEEVGSKKQHAARHCLGQGQRVTRMPRGFKLIQVKTNQQTTKETKTKGNDSVLFVRKYFQVKMGTERNSLKRPCSLPFP